MTMHLVLNLRDDIEGLYVLRKEGERGQASIKDTVDTSVKRLRDYIHKNEPPPTCRRRKKKKNPAKN